MFAQEFACKHMGSDRFALLTRVLNQSICCPSDANPLTTALCLLHVCAINCHVFPVDTTSGTKLADSDTKDAEFSARTPEFGLVLSSCFPVAHSVTPNISVHAVPGDGDNVCLRCVASTPIAEAAPLSGLMLGRALLLQMQP